MRVEIWYANGKRLSADIDRLSDLPREGVLFIFLFGEDGKRRELMRGTDHYAIWVRGRRYLTFGWDVEDLQFRIHSMDQPHGIYKIRKRALDLPRASIIFDGEFIPQAEWYAVQQEAFAYHG